MKIHKNILGLSFPLAFGWRVKTYTIIKLHNLYTQPPELVPNSCIKMHNLYHFEISTSASTTYTKKYNVLEMQIIPRARLLLDSRG